VASSGEVEGWWTEVELSLGRLDAGQGRRSCEGASPGWWRWSRGQAPGSGVI